MPGGDRTGPRGDGPMTGRGSGYCSGEPVRSAGQGRGRGRGRMRWRHGRGGCWDYGRDAYSGDPPVSRAVELDMLRDEAAQLERALHETKRRITELEPDKDE